MRGKFVHGRQRMLTRDLFAVANPLVKSGYDHDGIVVPHVQKELFYVWGKVRELSRT